MLIKSVNLTILNIVKLMKQCQMYPSILIVSGGSLGSASLERFLFSFSSFFHVKNVELKTHQVLLYQRQEMLIQDIPTCRNSSLQVVEHLFSNKEAVVNTLIEPCHKHGFTINNRQWNCLIHVLDRCCYNKELLEGELYFVLSDFFQHCHFENRNIVWFCQHHMFQKCIFDWFQSTQIDPQPLVIEHCNCPGPEF